VARRRVALDQSIKSAFDNAPSFSALGGSFLGSAVGCFVMGIWWWITGVPASPNDPSPGSQVSSARRSSTRSPTRDGWYQQDGRWYCEAHDTPFCKVCPTKPAASGAVVHPSRP